MSAPTDTRPDVNSAGLAIRTRLLAKRYPGGDGVKGLDLEVPCGCKFGLLGPNGAGKSTTIKMLMGLIAPTSGDAAVLGAGIGTDAVAIRARVGYVPERHYIYQWMTVDEVIWFTRSFYPNWNDTFCDELIEQYGLDTRKKVKQLSHGMVTKLALTLALSHEPELLLLDEPTTGLDPLIREEFLEGILHPLLEQSSRTVFFSSHIMSDVEKVSDTIGIINEGRLLICRPRAKLLQGTKRIGAVLKDNTKTRTAPAGTVWQHVEDTQWTFTVHGFSRATLEELHRKNAVTDVHLQDLDLEEIFKDFIKGARQS